jgi:hypothetical protein
MDVMAAFGRSLKTEGDRCDPLKDGASGVGHWRRFWEQSFDRLNDHLYEFQSKEYTHGHTTW